jgi:DNA-binding transcriptional LysR family regulator
MELRHLRYFVAVAEELNFRRAALRLHITQPPLSNRIAALERELGVKLFLRVQKKILLTPAGTAFLEEARAAVLQANKAVNVAKAVARGEFGQVRIGYNRYSSYELLPWFIAFLYQHFPDVEPVPVMTPMQEIVRYLEMGKIDIGLTRTPIISPILDWKVIQRDCVAVIVPIDHAAARQKHIPLRSLRNETFIVPGQQYFGAYANVAVSAWESAGFTPMHIEEVDSLPTMLALVSIRRGVGLIARRLMVEQAWPDVVALELSDVDIHCDLAVVWRKDETFQNCRNLIERIQTTSVDLESFYSKRRRYS